VVSDDDADPVSRRWSQWRAETDLDEYHHRWRRLEASGQAAHGEADFIESFGPRSVLDAGCGMGRVAIELARRGMDVVGVDLDDDLLAYARQSNPTIQWVTADLSTMQLGRRFDVVAMPGNVMVFCRPEDRGPIIATCAQHLEPHGRLVAGFQLEHDRDALTVEKYDVLCDHAGLTVDQRWSTWEGDPYDGGDYAVSVHSRYGRKSPDDLRPSTRALLD
jgi:2-polyprenyl-3-methyl-5-hydroxy-6-metoxy-1,4-benzoquinol methylase